MKVFDQIQCLNEEQTLPSVLASIPLAIDGVHQTEVLIMDDRSSDRTIEVANDRQKDTTEHFSPFRKAVQRLGSNVAKRLLVEEQLKGIKEIQYRV